MRIRALVLVSAALGLGLLAGSGAAQDLPSNGRQALRAAGPSGRSDRPPSPASLPGIVSTYGAGVSVLAIPADAFSPIDSAMSYTFDGPTAGRLRNGASPSSWFDAPVQLPSGAHIVLVAFEVYDADPAANLNTWIGIEPGALPGQATTFTQISDSADVNGWSYIYANVDVTTDNLNYDYILQVSMANDGGLHILRRGLVYYTLQVSPAPATASFGDVPTTHQFFQFVEALKASGITGGCGGGNYCPDSPVTRGQMAVFLSKALGLYWPN